MPEIIERGYLYIAQPPLYKLKKSGKEQYLKNDAELQAYLLKTALESVTVTLAAKPVPASQLAASLKACFSYNQAVKRYSFRAEPEVINGMILDADFGEEHLGDEKTLKDRLKVIEEYTKKNGIQEFTYTISQDMEHSALRVEVITTTANGRKATEINKEFVTSPEYKELGKMAQNLLALGFGPFKLTWANAKEVAKKEAEAPVLEGETDAKPIDDTVVDYNSASDVFDLADKILAFSKKGVSVQRYKGLGEMNAEQLWETTMDPSRRILQRVTVEDAVSSDNIFSVLMGDAVEPRREFIEANALRVKNLDV
jgi:DNA gyrase subunit B